MNLNERALSLCRRIDADADLLRIAGRTLGCGARVLDFGIDAQGGLEAGRRLAEVCLAGLGDVQLVHLSLGDRPTLGVQVRTDHPVLACLASQYAGWEVKGEGYFAMGSGPMRAVAAREPLFADLNYHELAAACVGVLEGSRVPPDAVCADIAEKCGISAEQLTLLVAATRSLAGTIQIVARSVETALHKLHQLAFDLHRVQSAWGSAPLPPPAADDLAAIGRTNDAILYGGRTVLYVTGDDATLQEIGEKMPSAASSDHGRPFAETLAKYDNDFYQVDPLLFSPAVATFVNLTTGNTFQFGAINVDLLRESFGETDELA